MKLIDFTQIGSQFIQYGNSFAPFKFPIILLCNFHTYDKLGLFNSNSSISICPPSNHRNGVWTFRKSTYANRGDAWNVQEREEVCTCNTVHRIRLLYFELSPYY